jgi:hypothetical protein
MKRTPVDSSNIHSIGYDDKARKLHVQVLDSKDRTKPGPIYEYDDVPAAKHAGLMAAGSKGSYFHQHIRSKPELHPFRKIAA